MLMNILLQVSNSTENVTNLNVVSSDVTAQMNYLELIMKGGVILIPIFILSLVSVFIFTDKLIQIRKGTRLNKSLLQTYKLHLKNGDVDMAMNSLQISNEPCALIFKAAVTRIGKPIPEIESAIESVTNIEVGKLNKNLSYLGLIAGIAPMLGFIGTISGIIKIFYTIAMTNNIGIGEISGGLYEKMISSGSGLIVGLLAYTFYHLLSMMIDKFISKIEEEAFDFLNLIQGYNNN